MSTTRADIVRDWLRHPGAKIVREHFKRAAVASIKEYDLAKSERELIYIQVKRQILTETIPKMLDGLTYKPDEKPQFSWRRLLGLK